MEGADGIQYCTYADENKALYSIIRRKCVVFGITVEEKEIPTSGQDILFVAKGGSTNEPVLRILPDGTFSPIKSTGEGTNNEGGL